MDFTLKLKALTWAIGIYPTYRLGDNVNDITNCYNIRRVALTVYSKYRSGRWEIYVRHAGRNRIDGFELKGDKFEIHQCVGKEVCAAKLYRRLEAMAERVFTPNGFRQIRSDETQYFVQNAKGDM